MITLAKDGKIDQKFVDDAKEVLLVLTEAGKAYNEIHIYAPSVPQKNLFIGAIDPQTGKVQSFKMDQLRVAQLPQYRGLEVFRKLSASIKAQAALGEQAFINMSEQFREYNIFDNGPNETVGAFTDIHCVKTIYFKLDANGDIASATPGRCH